MPTAPALNITNAIGLRAMVGPPIKIDSTSGNHSPRQGSIVFRGDNIVPSMTVDFIDAIGDTITQPVTIQDGSTFSVVVPEGAETGLLTMDAPTGDVAFEHEPIFVATHGSRQVLTFPGQIPDISSRIEGGDIVWGFTVTGTADQLGELFSLIPPSALDSFDIEFEIYPYDPLRDVAGVGTVVPVAIDVDEVDADAMMIAPASGVQTPPTIEYFGNDGIVLKTTFEDVEGDLDITIDSSAPGTFEYMAVVRIRATGP